MASVTITSPVEGYDVDDVVVDSLPHEDWYLANGYARLTAPAADSLRLTTSVVAANDPTLAANRERPNDLETADQGETPGVDFKSVDATDATPDSQGASQDRGPDASGFNAPADDGNTTT